MPGLTFLIIDDNELQRRLAHTYLVRAGHQAMFASTAEEVEAMLSAHEASVVLLSAALSPTEARAALAAALKSRVASSLPPPAVVVGAVPGDAQREQVTQLLGRGAVGCVARPYERERLAPQLELYSVGSAPATVLVVDDSPTTRRATVGILDKAGHAAIEAESGQAALELLDAHPEIDMVLSDVVMPEMDGYQLCRAVRARKGGRDLPFVMLTALEDIASQSRAVEVGVDDVLTKPISAAELQARVRATLRLKMLQRKLQRTNEELKVAMHLRDDLTHMIVHDFKNPLSVVLVSADMIEEMTREGGMEPAAEMARDIVAAALRLKRFSETLLDVSRLEAGAVRPQVSEFVMAEVATALMADLRPLADRHQVIMASDVADDLLVRGDREWTYRVLQNLVDNALKHAPYSSRVTIRGTRTMAGARHMIEIAVVDGGSGIPEEQRVRIFDKFTQLAGAERRGSGLGLAFCRLAVEAQGGAIEVRNVVSPATGAVAGAEFAFTLPAA